VRRGSVTKKGGRWYIVVSVDRPAQRCSNCPETRGRRSKESRGRRFWVEGSPLSDCPNCRGPLSEPGLERRRHWEGGFDRKKDAEDRLTEVLPQVRHRTYRPTNVTLSEFLNKWLDSIEGTEGLKPSTLSAYGTHVRKYLSPELGSLRLGDLSPEAIGGVYARLLTGGLSPATVRRVHSTLHRSLRDAVRWGRLSRNPAADMDLPRTKRIEIKVWDQEQVRRFLDSVRDDPLRPLYLILASTGVRRGEALALRWTDLDLNERKMMVRRSLMPAKGGPRFETPKNGKERTISLGPATVAALQEHRRRQVEARLAFGEDYRDLDLVFCREDGSPLAPGYLSHQFARQARRSGLPVIRLHDLRHSHATILLNDGVPAPTVAARLGHYSPAFTLAVYGHPSERLDERAAGLADFA
jgi:integrase